MAKTLNKKFPIFYYISPQIWAWRKKRIESIKRYIEKMIVIFKFEQDFYKKEGVDVLYFGHPLLEIINKPENSSTRHPEEWNNEGSQKNIISFLPGSRKNEVKKHLPIMQKTKEILEKELPDYHFQVIRPKNLDENFYQSLSSNMNIIEHSYQAIQDSKFIITSSGTATVEISILEVPYIIIYKMNPLTWQILKRIVNTNFVGMANILSGKKIVDELLQREACPKQIAALTLKYLKDKDKYRELKEELKKIKDKLLPDGATDKLASYIGNYLRLIKL
ncbi:MAG: lipid-A-disaccharide synthase [Candidatus Omnitrophota bacterium]